MPNASPSRRPAARNATLRFLAEFLRAPAAVGAIAPSGPALGRLMARAVPAGDGPVVELGPGTGAITEPLLAHGVKRADLVLIEAAPGFAEELAQRFAGVEVIAGDAWQIGELIGARRPRAVVCGLPLRNFPPSRRRALIEAAFSVLAPGGRLVLFTYAPTPPLPAAEIAAMGLAVRRVGVAWANLPPAWVFALERAGEPDLRCSAAD